uniref:protein Hook homolog 3-like n=1 Tax=Myxine glutinosa TaxID=7769 RepID=UPI00358FAF0E
MAALRLPLCQLITSPMGDLGPTLVIHTRVEVSREEFRVRCEELEREALLQDQKNRQLLSIAEEAQSMKDEMDVLRHSSDRVTQLEAAVESYRRKLDDLGDLRRQVRELEDRNSEQVRSTVLLEEDLRRANAVRAQLDAFKEQIEEVQDRASMEARRADKFEFECKKLQERLDTVNKEKERLRVERNSLQEAIDDLRCSQERAKYLGNLPQGSPPARTLDQEMLPQELRQRLLDLQHENRQLRVAQENAENNEIVRLKTLVEDGERQRNELLTENRLLNQRVLELQSSVESLQNMLQERGVQASDSISLTKKMEEHREKLTEDGTVLQMKREYIDGLQPKSGTNSPTVEELQAALLKKDKDMKSMEDRYRRYLVKARSVIKTLDPKNQPQYHPELQQLKNQLQEKDRIVQALEKECEKTKQDEKLLVSAWYNMGISLPQHGSDWKGTGGAAQSFLAQQRRATSNRRIQGGHGIHGGQR